VNQLDIVDRVTGGDIIGVSDALSSEFEDLIELFEVISIDDIVGVAYPIEGPEIGAVIDELSILAEWGPFGEDDVSINEVVLTHMEIALADEISCVDRLTIAEERCFGSCGFGILPFGAKTLWFGDSEDFNTVLDTLSINIGREEADTEEITDEFVISDGFGNPVLGDGFGVVPFGE